jgi:hypothetical protein
MSTKFTHLECEYDVFPQKLRVDFGEMGQSPRSDEKTLGPASSKGFAVCLLGNLDRKLRRPSRGRLAP